jgi:hypothetical protein
MSGWVSSDPDCERCQNSGFAFVELATWRHVSCALIECPDCYPYKKHSDVYGLWQRDIETVKA